MGGQAKGARGTRVLVALVLAGALLVCHGFLGASHVLAHGGDARYAHQASAGCCAVGDPGAHHAGGNAAPHGAPSPLEPAEGLDYFAALIALAGVVLLLAASRGVSRAPAGPRLSRVLRPRRFAPLPLPRGPSLPILQVFRL